VRITGIKAIPVNIPLEAPYRWSVGTFPGFSKTIVEVETDAGITGIGEAPNPYVAPLIEATLGPALQGADPYDLADCERRCLPPIRVLKNTDDDAIRRAFGGVEMALWDLIGKLERKSVASLLGGRVRDTVAFTEYFALRLACDGRGGEANAADVARYCARMQEEHGSTAFEGKVGVESVGTEVAIVREVREAIGPDSLLRLDANMGWSTTVARDALRQFERFDVQSVEEPVRSLAEMARLRSSTSIAFSSHEPDLKTGVALGVPDAFVINLTALGGIRRSLSFIAACEELGVDVWFYSPDAGIANAAYLQVAAATEWISRPSQTLLRWHTDDVIAEGPFRPERNLIPVPDGPGLGVTLDRAALARCHERFLADGPYDQYTDPTRSGYVR
jgi:glucarate dehydratase